MRIIKIVEKINYFFPHKKFIKIFLKLMSLGHLLTFPLRKNKK